MAAFAQHIQFSSLLGAGYAAALWWSGVEPTHAILSGALCGISGMLPDLDSDSGKPTKEIFGVTAAIVPLLLVHRLRTSGMTPEGVILTAGAVYLAIRFGVSWVFKCLTVHRGMFHSLPAALIAAEIVFLAHLGPETKGRLMLAGGVLIGFLSHLVLDEIYSINASGLRIRLNKSAGSALKLFSGSMPATLLAYLILGGLTYLVGVDQGYLQPINLNVNLPHAANVQQQ
jgi:membrane-bound metal-dependent hydrolase YbcI (DUF457 family)